jgi:hypothetical protein
VCAEHGYPKTICNRFIRSTRMGVFNKVFTGSATSGGKPETPCCFNAGVAAVFGTGSYHRIEQLIDKKRDCECADDSE